MELLEVSPDMNIIKEVLRLVNQVQLVLHRSLILQIVSGCPEILINLCLVGGIPAVMHFAAENFSTEIHMEVASFIKFLCENSTTLQVMPAYFLKTNLSRCLWLAMALQF